MDMIRLQKPLHCDPSADYLGKIKQAILAILLVLGDHPTDCNSSKGIHILQHSVQRLASHIVKIHVNATRTAPARENEMIELGYLL